MAVKAFQTRRSQKLNNSTPYSMKKHFQYEKQCDLLSCDSSGCFCNACMFCPSVACHLLMCFTRQPSSLFLKSQRCAQMSLLNKDSVASTLHVLSQCGVRHLPLPVTAHSKPFPGTELCILHRLHGTYCTSVHTAYSVHTVYCILGALHCMSHSVELDCVLLDCVLHCKAAISALVPTHSLVCEGNAKHSWACYMRTLVMRCCTVLVCI